MKVFRYPLILFIISVILSSCEGYTEKGIEGRWQLREVITADGTVNKVDTVFYSFDKKVFEYLKLTTPTKSFHCFGNYNEANGLVKIVISENSFEPKDCESCLDWDTLERTFVIKEQSSSKLKLELSGETYNFRKF